MSEQTKSIEDSLAAFAEKIYLLEDMKDFVPELRIICYEKGKMPGTWIFFTSVYCYGDYKKVDTKDCTYRKAVLRLLAAGGKILQIKGNIHTPYKELSAFVDKVEEILSTNPKQFCTECNKTHETIAFCRKCSACLYKNSVSLQDLTYPLFKCNRCNQINFWD